MRKLTFATVFVVDYLVLMWYNIDMFKMNREYR
jgi:hypothetical protein